MRCCVVPAGGFSALTGGVSAVGTLICPRAIRTGDGALRFHGSGRDDVVPLSIGEQVPAPDPEGHQQHGAQCYQRGASNVPTDHDVLAMPGVLGHRVCVERRTGGTIGGVVGRFSTTVRSQIGALFIMASSTATRRTTAGHITIPIGPWLRPWQPRTRLPVFPQERRQPLRGLTVPEPAPSPEIDSTHAPTPPHWRQGSWVRDATGGLLGRHADQGCGCAARPPCHTGRDVGPSITAAFVPSPTCALSTGGRSLITSSASGR